MNEVSNDAGERVRCEESRTPDLYRVKGSLPIPHHTMMGSPASIALIWQKRRKTLGSLRYCGGSISISSSVCGHSRDHAPRRDRENVHVAEFWRLRQLR